jgi:hypothetical protein
MVHDADEFLSKQKNQLKLNSKQQEQPCSD